MEWPRHLGTPVLELTLLVSRLNNQEKKKEKRKICFVLNGMQKVSPPGDAATR